jgi:hypothetical protein
MKLSKITKIAGAGLIGFCAVSLAADKIALNPVASQVAGFAGAFLGSLMAKRRSKAKQVLTNRAIGGGEIVQDADSARGRASDLDTARWS